MAYRKITVDDKEYEYVVGKSFTKIKGIGNYSNDHIGHELGERDRYNVKPSDISSMIKHELSKKKTK